MFKINYAAYIVLIVVVVGIFVIVSGNSISVTTNDITGQAISNDDCILKAKKAYDAKKISTNKYNEAVERCRSLTNKVEDRKRKITPPAPPRETSSRMLASTSDVPPEEDDMDASGWEDTINHEGDNENVASPFDEDTDGDGFTDDIDTCPGYDDELDADSDGVPDGCENEVLLSSILPEIHPETYGTNYFTPGTYELSIGDGIGNGEIIFKLVALEDNMYVPGSPNYAYFEAFKLENDGNYYHVVMPLELKKSFIVSNIISNNGLISLFGLTFKTITPASENSVTVAYLDDDACMESCLSTVNVGPLSAQFCSSQCIHETLPDEIALEYSIPLQVKYDAGTVSTVYPQDYADLGEFKALFGEQCYALVKDFLNIDFGHPSISFKGELSISPVTYGALPGGIFFRDVEADFDLAFNSITYIGIYHPISYEEEFEMGYCPEFPYPDTAHEITHMFGFTSNSISNQGLKEGLADFVEFKLQAPENQGYGQCLATGIAIPSGTLPYLDLGSATSGTALYSTGRCFWTDIYNTYGEGRFVQIIQRIYAHSRGIEEYDIFEIIEEVLGEPLDEVIVNRYFPSGIDENTASVTNNCINCEMFG